MVMVAYHCECSGTHGVVDFKMVRRLDVMLCKFYFQKKNKKIRGEREGFCPESLSLSLSLFPVPCLSFSVDVPMQKTFMELDKSTS